MDRLSVSEKLARADSGGRQESDDFLVRGLMKKHEDHVRVLEALIYNQETLVSLKDAKIEELEDNKQQLQFHVTKLQDNQLFFDEQSAEWEQERLDLSSEISKLKEHNERLSSELNIRSMTVDKLKNKVQSLKSVIVTMKSDYEHMTSLANISPSSSSSPPSPTLSPAANSSIQHLVNCREELQSKIDALAAENLSLKHQLEASCRRNDQLQAALQAMEVDVVATRERDQDLQCQIESLEQELQQVKDERDARIYQQDCNNNQQLPSAIQRRINIKVQLMTARREKRRTRLTSRAQQATHESTSPVSILAGSDAAVYGVTVLNNELFVVRWKQADCIEVYDAETSFQCLRFMPIIHLQPATSGSRLRSLLSYLRVTSSSRGGSSDPDSELLPARLTDITSCHISSTLYASDLSNCRVLRMRPDDAAVMAEWPVEGGAYGLSVTASGDLIVCCTGAQELRQYLANGRLLKTVSLPTDCLQPWHAVQLPSTDHVAVCHGGRYWDDDVGRLLNDPLHRVCVVDWTEQVHDIHGCMPGAGPATVCYPIYLATFSSSDVDGAPYLLVADSDNDRVKLLGARLDYICDVLRPVDGLCGPYRLSVDKTQTLLAVGCVDGRVFVYRIRDLLPDSVIVSAQT